MSKFDVFILDQSGDASEDLKRLYAEGWRLVGLIQPWAIALPEKFFDKNSMTGNLAYLYGIRYIFEREKTMNTK